MEMLSPLWLGLIALGAVGLCWQVKLFGSKAGRSLLLLGFVASCGFHQLRQKPSSRPYQSAAAAHVAAAQTINGQGRIGVRPAGAEADLFQHFQATGAASLSALQQLNPSEWVAVFAGQSPKNSQAPALERRYLGWFERALPESNETLPFVKNYQALGGDIRIADASSGETLFAYQADAAFKPVAIVRNPDRFGHNWQIIFSNQPGMLSQNRSR